ncbi:MAG: nucleotide sugar dehydrogenase [Myxococcales bacterium]|nr:nucleotide sugar dehydrogenase [Myxococcales bacterium]
MDLAQQLIERITNKDATVGVIGLGYVGLPLALTFAEQGFRVLGFDIDQAKVEALTARHSYISYIDDARLQRLSVAVFGATTDFTRVRDCHAVLICVPTPLTKNREPDMSYIQRTCESISACLDRGQLIVLESTTYPGTTEEVVRPILEKSGLHVGESLFLAYSPEREDPNNPDYHTGNIPKLVGGCTDACREVALALYGGIVERLVPVSSTRVAEATKIVENTFRAVNIALVNELKIVFTRMGIDIWEVLEAAGTKPFGFMKFKPGPGLGGHCVPIDPFYLSWKALEYDSSCRFIEMAGEINTFIPYWVVNQIVGGLSQRGVSLKGARLLMIGLSYKKNVDDDRESPAYKLIDLLEERGARVDYHDPYIPAIKPTRRYQYLAGRQSVPIERVAEFDAVIVATDHDCIDWDAVIEGAAIVADTRGVYRELDLPKLIKA